PISRGARLLLFSLLAPFFADLEESRHVNPSTTQHPSCEHSRLPRQLRQLRSGARERVGLFSDLRPASAADAGAGGSAEFSGHLSKPATGESAADDPAAERGPIRTGIWGNQTGSRHKASGADSLRRGQRPDDDDLEGQGERTPAGISKSMRPL